jgi:hypothetical protein
MCREWKIIYCFIFEVSLNNSWEQYIKGEVSQLSGHF